MASFVLVHGAFQGGWVWKDVVARLQTAGHDAHAPTLSGCGYLSNGFREGLGLHAYIQDVASYLFYHDLVDVILVGHSYSGMVCAAAASRMPQMIRRMVFVDAVIPESNRSFADLGGEAFRAMLDAHRAGDWKVNPWPLPVFGVPEARADWFAPRLRPFPEAAFTTPFPGEFDPELTPGAFVACAGTRNPLIKKMAGKAKDLGWPVESLDSDHSPMTTHPEQLADVLDGLAS